MKIAKLLLSLGYTNIEQAKEKMKFYKRTLKCSLLEVIEMVKIQPHILDLTEERIVAQFQMLQEKLHINEMQASKLIQKNPNFLGMSSKFISQKIIFIKNLFNVEEVEPYLQKAPELLFCKDSILSERVNFLEKTLLLSSKQREELIKNYPGILKKEIFGYVEKNIYDIIQYFSQIMPKEAFVKNPMILTLPARKLKVRFLILAPIFDKEEILSGNNLLRNESLLWARREFLRKNGLDLKLILANKKTFEGISKISDNELIKRNPLNSKSIALLEKEYFDKFGQHLKLDKNEKNAIFTTQKLAAKYDLNAILE